MLPNRASCLLPVDSEPAILNALSFELHRVTDRNAGRNHELHEQRCNGDFLRRECFRNLSEKNLDFLLSEWLRFQSFFVLLRQPDCLQCGKQVVEVFTTACPQETTNVLLGLLASGCPPYLVPARPKFDYVRRRDEGRKQLRPG